MDEPEVVQAAEVASAEEAASEPGIVQAGPKSRYPSLLAALLVALVGIVGQILLSTVPGQEWGSELWQIKLHNSLSVVATALMFLGVFWLGALLSYRGILKSRR